MISEGLGGSGWGLDVILKVFPSLDGPGWVSVNPSLAEGLQQGRSSRSCAAGSARGRAEPRAVQIDRHNPKLHHPVLRLSFVSVQ